MGMSERWVNPKYADLVAEFDQLTEGTDMTQPAQKPNCSQCSGVGRHIVLKDPSDPSKGTHSVTCMACGGSGKQR